MMRHTLALLLLVAHSPAADAAGQPEPRQRKALSPAERISRPVSEANPFGLDYGFHPVNFTSGQGVPTHQMSMLTAQIAFAEEQCTAKPKPTGHQRALHRAFVNAHDKDLDQPYKAAYAQAVGRKRANYQNAWNGMGEAQRSEYCAAYWNDVRYFSEGNLIARGQLLLTFSMFYLGALSPLSNESIEEIERKCKRLREDSRRILENHEHLTLMLNSPRHDRTKFGSFERRHNNVPG